MIAVSSFDSSGFPMRYVDDKGIRFNPSDWVVVIVQLMLSDKARFMIATQFGGDSNNLTCIVTDPNNGDRIHCRVGHAIRFEVIKVINK